MFESLRIQHLGYWMIAIAVIAGLYLGRKSVKSGVCGFHKFGFCQADQGLAPILGGGPDSRNFQKGLSDTGYNPHYGYGGGGGGCTHSQMTKGECNVAPT